MTLWLDIGNSRVKGWWTPTTDAPATRTANRAHAGRPAEAVAALVAELTGRGNGGDATTATFTTTAWLADVTGADHRASIDDALARAGLGFRRAVVTPGLYGLVPAYAEPGRLGIDRFLMMLALRAERAEGGDEAGFGVAAAGTALTFDAVTADGRHLGGVIGPGLWTAGQAVRATTRFAVAPQDSTGPTFDDGLGRDTEACVRQGAFHACAGLLDRLGARVPRRVLCGGDAATLLPHLRDSWEHRPELVLDGLRAWARSLSSGGALARPGGGAE